VLYRRSRGLKSADLQPATLIQEMAPADVSGVIFTRHPVDGADEAVINAAYGLGEGVVSGAVTPDSYAADKTTGEETRLPRISRKPWRIGAGGMETVPKELRGRRALGPGQVRDLALTAAAVERRFGRPMDVEFSISNGRIVILQARPITTR
jgi:pyruvate,water dikinase